MSELEQNLKNIADELVNLLVIKNKDYGNAFEDMEKEMGGIYVYMELMKKMKRMKTWVDNGGYENKNESIQDTLTDIAGYALLYKELLNRYSNNL